MFSGQPWLNYGNKGKLFKKKGKSSGTWVILGAMLCVPRVPLSQQLWGISVEMREDGNHDIMAGFEPARSLSCRNRTKHDLQRWCHRSERGKLCWDSRATADADAVCLHKARGGIGWRCGLRFLAHLSADETSEGAAWHGTSLEHRDPPPNSTL